MLGRPLLLALASAATLALAAPPQEDGSPEVPPAFAPFEHLIGGWKGTGIPAKNPLKGWREKQMWAWKFAKGKPVGMTLEITGGKILAKAQLSGDAKTREYKLEGTDPEGKPIAFAGKLDDNDILRMERLDPPAEVGKERLDLALNQNKIRYTLRLFRQEPGSPQFAPVIDANMGKEGESFAAGGAAANLPKCILTGGAATMTVSYMRKSYPVCCSGCRDEFNDNPEKYVKKYEAKVAKGELAPASAEAKDEDAPASKAAASPKAMPKSSSAEAKAKAKPAAPKDEPKEAEEKARPDANARAASLLTQASALERSGKKAAALIYYKRIGKEFPDSPSAKTANAKIKALGK